MERGRRNAGLLRGGMLRKTKLMVFPLDFKRQPPRFFFQRFLTYARQAVFVGLSLAAVAAQASSFLVTNTAASGNGSLHDAIQAANVASGASSISFDIPGSGPQTIAGSLPNVSASVSIDGTTQPGYAGAPLIEIQAGLTIQGSHCQVRGLALGSSNGALGLLIQSPGGSNTVTACFIGTGLYGTNFLNLSSAAIHIKSSSGNQIGATNAALRNLLWGGSNSAAITIDGFNSAGNVIEGNWIGVDISGTKRLPGAVEYGIDLEDSSSNAIGAPVPGAGNVIDGATSDGIILNGSGCTFDTIQGNFIGTDPSGKIGWGNQTGILLDYGASNLIGGATLLARNIISSNSLSGIDVWGDFSPPQGGGNLVQGNFVGTDVTGTKALPNGGIAIFVSSSVWNLIGGAEPGQGNVLSGNGGPGVYFNGNSNTLAGNIIGLDVSGEVALGNGGNGVTLGGGGNEIGGLTEGAGNIISANQVYGIYEYGGGSNTIQGNFIGVDATGQFGIGNTYDGISLDGVNSILIGGTNAGAGNVIAGNGTEGICIGRYA